MYWRVIRLDFNTLQEQYCKTLFSFWIHTFFLEPQNKNPHIDWEILIHHHFRPLTYTHIWLPGKHTYAQKHARAKHAVKQRTARDISNYTHQTKTLPGFWQAYLSIPSWQETLFFLRFPPPSILRARHCKRFDVCSSKYRNNRISLYSHCRKLV